VFSEQIWKLTQSLGDRAIAELVLDQWLQWHPKRWRVVVAWKKIIFAKIKHKLYFLIVISLHSYVVNQTFLELTRVILKKIEALDNHIH
jgi:hypothetical protein